MKQTANRTRVLYVVGTNLSMNTSANISHNAYVQGLLENGCEVDILMANDSWGEKDDGLPTWKEAKYFIYDSISLADRLKKYYKNVFERNASQAAVQSPSPASKSDKTTEFGTVKIAVRDLIKKGYELLFDTTNIYTLNRTWLRNGLQFRENSPYDLIISNSSPAASHKMVLDLLAKKRITKTRWIQIWEDPWYFDLYGGHSEKVKHEEHRLLRAAEEIFYVSTLTLHYQKKHFTDCAHKMKHIPLPYLQFVENKNTNEQGHIRFGYFGDYYSHTRNLLPFYEALAETGAFAYINGDTDLDLPSTDKISVNGRVTLDRLNELQDKTSVLVHLCNLHGGQIPGKIYHYSATTKPIVFILDGAPDEIEMIEAYFSRFDRYYFCRNTKASIGAVLKKIGDQKRFAELQPVKDFAPKEVISQVLLNYGQQST